MGLTAEVNGDVQGGLTASRARMLLQEKADPEQARNLSRFFKTGTGDYGEGDRFYGIKVPETRKISKLFRGMPLAEIADLLHSEMHEERLLALIVLTDNFSKADDAGRDRIYHFYMNERKWVNNWDLVDSSAGQIAGGWLLDRDKSPLFKLAESDSLWDRRIAVIATFHFIRNRHFDTTLQLAEKLLNDQHDLIHKAVGWMLREIGKRDEKPMLTFLDSHCRTMPRTMLRYAIEKLDVDARRRYLTGNV
jgi:3-methyladenine DNA glycosylase AlkD